MIIRCLNVRAVSIKLKLSISKCLLGSLILITFYLPAVVDFLTPNDVRAFDDGFLMFYCMFRY